MMLYAKTKERINCSVVIRTHLLIKIDEYIPEISSLKVGQLDQLHAIIEVPGRAKDSTYIGLV